ncbi:MAG: site-2 protease family protein [Candidatus Omnitrophica bacterium]|nr:site-2 protease family protein [Candidatus Omnitrophota bacterium]
MTIIFFIIILFLSITIHEFAHGWIAYKLGDLTAKHSGRLTLNPLAHIDPFGTVVLPILTLIISRGLFPFGYAKPVPINPYNFKNPKKDIRWVGLAGPGINIIFAIILTLIIKLNISFLQDALKLGVLINLILAIFNLIPIPPLDGSKILASLLPNKYSYPYLKMEKYGFLIIIFLIMSGFIKWFLIPLVNMIANNILGINFII